MTDTLPPEDRYVVETNSGTTKTPILKHRLKDAHSAPSPRDNLRERVVANISTDQAKMDKFTVMFAALKVPALRADAEPLTYDEWVLVDNLIAEFEPMASADQREGYRNMVSELATAMYGNHTHTLEVCNLLDAYNIDPRVLLLTTGRVEMGLAMAGELIAHFDMRKLSNGIPTPATEEPQATKAVAKVANVVEELGGQMVIESDVAPTSPPPSEVVSEPAQEPSNVAEPAPTPVDAAPLPTPSVPATDLADVISHHLARINTEVLEIVQLLLDRK